MTKAEKIAQLQQKKADARKSRDAAKDLLRIKEQFGNSNDSQASQYRETIERHQATMDLCDDQIEQLQKKD